MLNRVKLPFYDDYWIDFRKGTVRRWFELEYLSAWRDPDFTANSYCQLLYDRELGKYRFYYEASPDISCDAVRYLALCESEDLKTFTPVQVNDHPEKRMRHVVFTGETGVHGSSVMFDPQDPDPSRRYKYAGMTRMGGMRDASGLLIASEQRGKGHPVVLAFSADGIHWEHHPELVAHPYTSDAYNKLYFNPYTQEYCLLHRSAFLDRRIMLRTSRDLKNWSRPKVILHPGSNYNDNTIEMQFYSMTAQYLDGIFLGLVWRFNTCLNDMDFSKMWGFMEPELVYSYDGEQFLFTSGRPVVSRPLPPAYGCAQLTLMDLCESADGKEYILCGGGSRVIHGTAKSNHELSQKLGGDAFGSVFYHIRKDGFCAIEGPGNGSNLITKPLELLRDDLTFNLRANCGSVRFGIMEGDGTFLPGFSFDDSVPYEMDDGIEVAPRWREHSLQEVLNRRVRVALELNGAMVHAMTATARPCIVQPQFGFHDPEQMD